ncbi:MAG: hypothetical protein HYR83_04990 [Planctomycetes bacterium]|nr:hypothetical protein [Planctomycetota bacterium]
MALPQRLKIEERRLKNQSEERIAKIESETKATGNGESADFADLRGLKMQANMIPQKKNV